MLRTAKRKVQRKTQSKICKHILISILVFVITLVGRVYISGKIVQENTKLKEVFADKTVLEKEVNRLGYDDNKLSSLESVRQRAILLGFVPMNAQLLTVDLTQSPPLALNTSR